MITLNSTILSSYKIKEIEEFKPILPPDSIYMPEEKINKSFQKFIPDIYDLDKIDFNDIKCRRNSAPIARNLIQLKNYLYSSMIINQNQKKDKYIESIPINIYNNEKEKSTININNSKDIDITKEEIEKTQVYKNEKNKIDNDINNNLNKKKEEMTNKNNKKNKNVNESSSKEEIVISKNVISAQNIKKDLLNSKIKNINIIKNKSKTKNKKDKIKKYIENNLDIKSNQSAVASYNYKNILRKDPNNENTIIINTSLYKRNKNYNDNNKSKNQSEINRNNSNSFLKFEDSSKDHSLINIKLNTVNQKDKKEELLKHIKKSNNNINIKNNNLDQSNLNSLINSNTNIIINNSKLEKSNININFNITNLNIEEKEEENEDEKEIDNNINNDENNNMKCNDLNKYAFKTSHNNIYKKITPNKITNISNNNNKNNSIVVGKEKNKNLKIGSNKPFIFNIINNNIENGNLTSKKPSIRGLSSLKKYNFDFPTTSTIKENDYSRDEDNKSKNSLNNKEENKSNINKENVKEKIGINVKQDIQIKFKSLKKIIKKNGLFNVLTFLDCYDLMNLLQTNKSLIFLINKSFSDAYYHKIKENLVNFNSNFELLKSSLIYSKVKDALKIDFVINIRFVNKIYKANIEKNENNEFSKNFEPKCFQVIYCYNYFRQINPNQKLKTKENTRAINMYDFYTYDLYSENDKTPDIYITKEQISFNINNNFEKLAFIQPILPFKINDKGIINLEIFTSNNNFVNPSSIKLYLKSLDLKHYLNNLKIKKYNDLRICEYENICVFWKYLHNEKSINDFKNIIIKIKKIFEPYFNIINISYENVGFFIFKINLIAVKIGKIDDNAIDNDLGINFIIRNKKDKIENEIKKNNLLLEKRNIYELRLGDKLILYISTKQFNNNKK